MNVEAVVTRWVLENHQVSNCELAGLSNVNRRWRLAVQQVLLSNVSSDLLLPSIVNKRVRSTGVVEEKKITDEDEAVTEKPTTFSAPSEETFCLAWFASEGIRQSPISIADHHEDHRRGRFYYDDDRSVPTRMRQRNRTPAMRESRNKAIVCREWKGYEDAWEVLENFGYDPAFVKGLLSLLPESPIPLTTDHSLFRPTTAAVRGATTARPESYCLCLDSQKEHQRLLDLQRDVLPRVVRTPARHSAVQFLNASGSHAVCLFTPEFACGPVPAPLTILVVGIALEDGCFVSGLQNRFELGHMYPADSISEATELSGICLATDRVHRTDNEVLLHGGDDEDSSDEGGRLMGGDNDDDNGSDDNYSDVDRIFLPNGTCNCCFDGICQKQCPVLPDDDDDDEDEEPPYSKLSITRGNTGPGAWHCYTAIADGSNSVVRVDGALESTKNLGETGARALLDGLTIGSDHCFDLSLCCGGGSGVAGQGAIAEVAVFSGRLGESDLQALERRMMSKYCIKKSWSDWERKAQGLFLRKHPQERVPLRYLTRNATVAWKLFHPTTAEPIRVSRIGSHAGASSSDF